MNSEKYKLRFLLILFLLIETGSAITAQGIAHSFTIGPDTKIYEKGSGQKLDTKIIMDKLQSPTKGTLIPKVGERGEIISYVYDSSRRSVDNRDWDTSFQVKPGEPLAPFFVKGINGEEISLETLKGKITVLNFQLKLQKPFFSEDQFLLFRNLIRDASGKADVAVVVFTQSEEAETKAWAEKNQISYSIAPDAYFFALRYCISMFPSCIVLNEKKQVVAFVEGNDPDELKKAIAKAQK